MLISCLDWLQWETINSFQKFSWNFSYICQYKWNKCSKCSRILPLSAEWCTPPHTHTHTHTHLFLLKKRNFVSFKYFEVSFHCFYIKIFFSFFFTKENTVIQCTFFIILLYYIFYYIILLYFTILLLYY